MLSLAFDTINGLSVALLEDDKIIANSVILESSKQSEMLIYEIEKILKSKNIWYQDLDLIISNKGPGSFTAVRVGMSAVKAMKIAINTPIILVNACEALAYRHRETSKKIITAIDALGDEFFYAEFLRNEDDVIEVKQPVLASVSEITKYFSKEKFLLCGSKSDFLEEILKKENFEFEIAKDNNAPIDAGVIGLLGYKRFLKSGGSLNFEPLYLRSARITKRN